MASALPGAFQDGLPFHGRLPEWVESPCGKRLSAAFCRGSQEAPEWAKFPYAERDPSRPPAVHLSGLQIRHFRNLAEQQLDLPAEGVAIVGENAQGKTNLLEAIYYLETFRSFRGSRDHRLVAFGEEFFRVVGSLEGEAPEDRVEVAAAFQTKGKRKKVTLNGEEPERLGDGLGRLAAVVFSPADVALVSEGPGARRRFLDIVLSLNAPGYLAALQRFRQVLSQRNAALEGWQGRGTVEVWDEGLIESGARVMEERLRWVERWQEDFSSYYQRVSGALDGRTGVPPGRLAWGSQRAGKRSPRPSGGSPGEPGSGRLRWETRWWVPRGTTCSSR